MSNLNKRLKYLIEEHLKITPYEFSQKIGNKRADNIYNNLKEVNPTRVSEKTLDKIIAAYPKIRRAWLLDNEGDIETSTSDTLNDNKFNNEKEKQLKPNMDKLIESLERTISMQERMIDTLTADKERLLIDNSTLRSENTDLRKQLEQQASGVNAKNTG